MLCNPQNIRRALLLFCLSLSLNATYAQDNLYWIGGSGDWNDPNHWSKASGSENQGSAGLLPDENFNVVFDDFSGLTPGSVVNVSPGQYAVQNFTVTIRKDFMLQFSGVSGNPVEMNILRNLTLVEEMIITYAGTSSGQNSWVFTGSGDHYITTEGQDLLSVQFNDENGVFNQLDDLEASSRIRFWAGTWNSDGHDVRTSFAWFRDSGNGPTTVLPKQLNTGGSDIFVEEWNSRLTYGSLEVNGPHRIFAEIFQGSPSQNNGPSFFFDEIILLELPDQEVPQTVSIVEYNNFECTECVVKTIRVRDTGNTKLAGKFTLTEQFVVENPGSVIQFNGGNGRDDEIILNGTVETPPVSGCNVRTVFTNAHNDFTTVIREAGTLTISNAELVNLQATGGADFNLSNGLLSGSSSGWNLLNQPMSIDFYWIGAGNPQDVADWDNPDHWAPDNGSPNGCLPTSLDNVIVDGNSKSGMRIPTGQAVECNDFIWDNDGVLELLIDGASGNTSRLVVGGDFYVDNSVLISSGSFREILFFSTQNNTIESNRAALPRLAFAGANGTWNLNDDLNCESIFFEGGTLITQNQGIVTDKWTSLGSDFKAYNFGSSHIVVNGDFEPAPQANSNLSLDPGTSLVECESLDYIGELLYDVKMINPAATSFRGIVPHTFNSLILAGNGTVSTGDDLTVKELIFEVDGARLRVGSIAELTVNEAIRSQTSAADPGILESRTAGIQVPLNKTGGNLCVDGPVAFQDIEALVDGVFHAPQGIDNGNNTGITFDDGLENFDLYWIGGSGDWDVRSNWSRISGGCPSSKDPSNMNRLFFDDNSFFTEGTEVAIEVEECQELYFSNSTFGVTLNVASALQAELLVLDDAEVDFNGKGLSVNTTTRVDNGGFLRLDLLNYLTGKLESNGGIIRVLPGTNAIVRPQ